MWGRPEGWLTAPARPPCSAPELLQEAGEENAGLALSSQAGPPLPLLLSCHTSCLHRLGKGGSPLGALREHRSEHLRTQGRMLTAWQAAV